MRDYITYGTLYRWSNPEMLEKTRHKIAEHLIAIANLLKEPIVDQMEADTQGLNLTETKPDSLAHLRFLENIEGMSETQHYLELKHLFKDHGIDAPDIRTTPWCGLAMRLAITAAGYPDPGEQYNRAENWKQFGEEAAAEAPGNIIVYRSHVSVQTEDGGEIGGNVSDSIRKMPKGENWFGTPIAHRKIAT